MSGLTKLVAIAVFGSAVMVVGVAHVQGSRSVPPAPKSQAPAPAAQIVPSAAAPGATLHADARGHFMADLQIRGVVIRALVDTGASVLSFSTEDAARFGLRAEGGHQFRRFQTANGIVNAAMVRIPEVRLQGITV
jgi:aspartyl protease family protein